MTTTIEENNGPTLDERLPPTNPALQSCLKITSLALFIICAGVGTGLLICTATNLLPAVYSYYLNSALLVVGISIPIIILLSGLHQLRAAHKYKAISNRLTDALQSSPKAVEDAENPVDSGNTLHSIEIFQRPIASDTPLDDTWELSWESFCKFPQPIQLQIDEQQTQGIDPHEILTWVPREDPKARKLLSKKITDIEKIRNFGNQKNMPNFFGDFATSFILEENGGRQLIDSQYQQMQLYLREIVRIVNLLDQTSSPEIASAYKQKVVEELSIAFKECPPTWYRCLTQLCLMVTLRQGASVEEACLRNIIAQGVVSYKEQVIMDARQLDPSNKDSEWHFVSYVSERIGDQIGLFVCPDFGYTFHRYQNEGKSDEELSSWFKTLCSAQGLVDYIFLQICSGQIPYKTDDGEFLFSSFILRHNLLPDNIEMDECYDEQFVPTRLAIALVLQEMGGIIVLSN